MGRDLTWDAIYTAAAHLDGRSPDTAVTVRASRKRSIGQWKVTEGLLFCDAQTDRFEPVRSRRFFSRDWSEEQPVRTAASKIGAYLRTGPELP